MNIGDSSFTSENESPRKNQGNLLCSQIEEGGGDWKWSNSQRDSERSIPELDGDGDNYMISPNRMNKLENQPELNLNNNIIELQPVVTDFEPNLSDASKPITLLGDSIFSKENMSTSERASQFSGEVDHESYASFLTMLECNYSPMAKSFEVLFENVSNLFGERVEQIERTYLWFLKIKVAQEKAYSGSKIGKTTNNKNQMIYIDCKGLTDEIRTKIEKQRKKQKSYADNIQYIYKKVRKNFDEVKKQVHDKEVKIRDLIKNLSKISGEMTDLMIPKNRKQKKEDFKTELLSTKYVRTKYLIGKEKSYLAFMKELLQKVSQFISFICFQVEPKNCLGIKEAMLAYIEAESIPNPQIKEIFTEKFQALSKLNCYEVIFKQISKLLQLCIPSTIEVNIERGGKNQELLHKIVENLISQSQNVVYIPVIEIQENDFAYHSKDKADVFWKCIDPQSKEKKEEEYEADIVITQEGYLILELLHEKEEEQKMAILKLSEVKLSRKNNEVIITDKGKGMFGYFLNGNNTLGSLIFQTIEEEGREKREGREADKENNKELALIEEFVAKAKEVLENKRQKSKK